MNSNLPIVDEFLLSLIVEKHHVDEDEENATVTLRAHAPLEEDEEDEVTEQRQQEDELGHKAQQHVLEISKISERTFALQDCRQL